MTLAGMRNLDEAALICDLAETYRVYDLRQLPLRTVAVLASGLRGNARIFRSERGLREEQTDLKLQMMAIIADRLSALLNRYGAKINTSIYQTIMGMDSSAKDDDRIVGVAFSSIEEFAKARYGGEQDG